MVKLGCWKVLQNTFWALKYAPNEVELAMLVVRNNSFATMDAQQSNLEAMEL